MKLTRVLLSILFFALLGLIFTGDPMSAVAAQVFLPVADPANIQTGSNEGWNGFIDKSSGYLTAVDANGALHKFTGLGSITGYVTGARTRHAGGNEIRVGDSGEPSIMLDQSQTYIISFSDEILIEKGVANGDPGNFMEAGNSGDVFYVYVIADSGGTNPISAVASLEDPVSFVTGDLTTLSGYDIFRHVGWATLRSDNTDVLKFDSVGKGLSRKYNFPDIQAPGGFGQNIETIVNSFSGSQLNPVPQVPSETFLVDIYMDFSSSDGAGNKSFRLGPEDNSGYDLVLYFADDLKIPFPSVAVNENVEVYINVNDGTNDAVTAYPYGFTADLNLTVV